MLSGESVWDERRRESRSRRLAYACQHSILRLGMMWPGAQPQKDKFNETYFHVAKQIVDRCHCRLGSRKRWCNSIIAWVFAVQGNTTSTPCWICTRMCCRPNSAEKEFQTGLFILGVSSGHFHDVASSFHMKVWFDIYFLLKLPKVFLSRCPSPMLWILRLVTRHMRSEVDRDMSWCC